MIMKYLRNYFLLLFFISFFQCTTQNDKPRVIITTDINNAGGDPDDKQSPVLVLWYADALDIVGIIPDYWNGKGYEVSMEVLDRGYPDNFLIFIQKVGLATSII